MYWINSYVAPKVKPKDGCGTGLTLGLAVKVGYGVCTGADVGNLVEGIVPV